VTPRVQRQQRQTRKYDPSKIRPLSLLLAQFYDWSCSTTTSNARFPLIGCGHLIEVKGDIVATSIGTLENRRPEPSLPNRRTVRLANVITLP